MDDIEFYNSDLMTKNALPRYLTYANQLREQIATGRFAPGEQLPSQRTLAEQFGTTVMTIRSALDLLSEQGLIRIVHGIGMYVVDNQLQEEEYMIVGDEDEGKLDSFSAETEIILINAAAVHDDAAKALDLDSRSSVARLERLRRVDGKPIVLQHSYVAPTYASLLQNLKAEQSLYEAIQVETGLAITHAREYLLPTTLDARRAAALNCVAGDAAWLSVRLSTNEAGMPLVYDEAWLPVSSLLITVDYFGRKNESTLHWRDTTSPPLLAYLLDS